jgi:calcium-dependent protein kinase
LELGDDTVRIEAVYHGVHDGIELGQGAGGVVRAVQHATTGLPYAVKILELHRLLTRRDQQPEQEQGPNVVPASTASIKNAVAQMEALQNEITIMSQLDHPHIARLQEVYQDENHIYLVQEVCRGGDLWEWLYLQPNQRLGEPVAQRIVWQILTSVRYLHSKGIVHRDLKLENFLFCTDQHELVKMIGTFFRTHHKTRCSSPIQVFLACFFLALDRLWIEQALCSSRRNPPRQGRYAIRRGTRSASRQLRRKV